MLMMLVYVLILVLIAVACNYALDAFGLPPPVNMIAKLILGIVLLIMLLRILGVGVI